MRRAFLLTATLVATTPLTSIQGQSPPAIRTTPLLRYDRIGSGPPLLLVHGYGGCAATWQPFDSTFSTAYQLIIPDLPGHGGSPRPSGHYTSRYAAAELIRLLDSQGMSHVRAVGISAGGLALIHAMILRPDLFDRVILVGASYTFPPEARAVLRHTLSLDSVPPPVRTLWQGCATGGPGQLDWLVREFHGMGDSYHDMNLEPADLRKITTRLLIVHGDRDLFFPANIPTTLHLAVLNSALWIIPFGDHVPIMGKWNSAFREQAMAFFAAP